MHLFPLNKPYEEQVAPLMEEALFSHELFKQNLQEMYLFLKPSTEISSYQRWLAVDTDSAEDLLLCGTEIVGSCQNIHTNGSTNRCLLGYLLDGKNRLACIKNAEGVIVARCLLKVLWDEANQSPVLLKERVYSQPNINPKILQALYLLCIQRAENLKLPLVQKSSTDEDLPLYPNTLVSFGNRAPFEYSDAEGGITNGHFSVSNSQIVFDPPKKQE